MLQFGIAANVSKVCWCTYDTAADRCRIGASAALGDNQSFLQYLMDLMRMQVDRVAILTPVPTPRYPKGAMRSSMVMAVVHCKFPEYSVYNWQSLRGILLRSLGKEKKDHVRLDLAEVVQKYLMPSADLESTMALAVALARVAGDPPL